MLEIERLISHSVISFSNGDEAPEACVGEDLGAAMRAVC